MAWKQDLAKLKQHIGPEAPPPKVPVRPVRTLAPPGTIEEEDDVFLSAMGMRAKPARPPRPQETPAESAPAPSAPPPPPETFEAALQDLKGLKPLTRGPLAKPHRPVPKQPAPAPAPKAAAAPTLAPVAPAIPATPPIPAVPPISATPPEPSSPSLAPIPLRFQLAAGMAIEVDGLLDLRGHSLGDALERLKDRLEDGLILGWHSLQVTLGTDPVLHEGLLDLLATGQIPMVGRYAQAPVPMGGSQAWLLYFVSIPTRVSEEARS
ncbi:MAG: Smr/MutS family protein [Acidobacteria bacterium]|nr:Smr/MutS family protein [Acidobacteriota bacterium]